jgi:hypothetical protein
VVLASDDLSYCFYIEIEAERKIAKEIVSGKWSPIVYTDDFVTGWKVAKNRPSWTFDADAWKKIVIGIQDKAARLRGLLSSGENFCDDISSSDCIDMDEGSIEDNEEKKILNKKYRTQRRMKNMMMTTIIISIRRQSMVRATETVAKIMMIRVIMNTMRTMKNMTMTMIIILRTKQSMVRATETVAKMTKICVIMNTMMA